MQCIDDYVLRNTSEWMCCVEFHVKCVKILCVHLSMMLMLMCVDRLKRSSYPVHWCCCYSLAITFFFYDSRNLFSNKFVKAVDWVGVGHNHPGRESGWNYSDIKMSAVWINPIAFRVILNVNPGILCHKREENNSFSSIAKMKRRKKNDGKKTPKFLWPIRFSFLILHSWSRWR